MQPLTDDQKDFREEMGELTDDELKQKFEDPSIWSHGKSGFEDVVHDENGDLFKDLKEENKKDLENQKIEVEDFWNDSLKIKHKRF